MKIVVTGARGYLASYLIPLLLPQHQLILTSQHPDRDPSGLTIHAINLGDKSQLDSFLHLHTPDLIINTAAVSLPDWAEDHPKETYTANVIALQNLIEHCEKHKCHLLQMSTDYVFSGNNAPYSELDDRSPVNYYGKTKAEAEEKIIKSSISYLICRTTMLYGMKNDQQRSNPFSEWYIKFQEKKVFDVPTIHITTPTFVEDLAQCIVVLIEKDKRGIYHTAGPESLSRYDLAVQMAEVFGFDSHLIHPIANVNKRAIRPLNTSLDCSKLVREINYRFHTPRESFQILLEKLSKKTSKNNHKIK